MVFPLRARVSGAVLASALPVLCAALPAAAQSPAPSAPASPGTKDDVPLTGTWSGTSLCQVKPSACTDEIVVYRFSSPDANGRYVLQGDKIVDGHPITMGRFTVTYDRRTKTLGWTGPGDARWSFVLDGAVLSGTLSRADGVVVRKVSLKKDG